MKTIMFLGAFTMLAGCASTVPVPADKLLRAQEALREAEAMPATASDPKAMEHLQLAKNQLSFAKKLMVEGENEDARWVLMRAEADAEVALALANAEVAKADAQQTIDAIRQSMTIMQKGSGS